jgi:hypothetical protein
MKKVFIKRAFTIAPVNLAYHVSCRKCRASGPIAPSAGEAIKGWEHRAPPLQNKEPPRSCRKWSLKAAKKKTAIRRTARACRIKSKNHRNTSHHARKSALVPQAAHCQRAKKIRQNGTVCCKILG